jgi:hypothetical protein
MQIRIFFLVSDLNFKALQNLPWSKLLIPQSITLEPGGPPENNEDFFITMINIYRAAGGGTGTRQR